MLEKIKIVLGITDTSKDAVITYYIESISNEVMSYCNIKAIPSSLQSLICNKVISIMKYENNQYKGIKSISEGDTKLEIAVENNGQDTLIYSLNDTDKKNLRSYRRCAF